MRMTRSLLLTGTILPALLLTGPSLARSPFEASARMDLAQLDEDGPRGGGGGHRGGGLERGGGERGGPAGRERPEPHQAPAARERPEPTSPALRERPEPRQAPAARERPEPATPPAARERPEPRQAPAARERPEPATPPAARERPELATPPAARERPEPRQAPAARDREAPERPVGRQTPQEREDRAPAAQPRQTPERPATPAQPARPATPTNDEPTRASPQRPTPPATPPAAQPQPGQRRDPDTPASPTVAPPNAVQQPARPADPAVPAPQGVQRPSRQPDQNPAATPPGTPPGAAPGASPTPVAPNQRPGVPGRPFVPPGQPQPGQPPQPDAAQPGQGQPPNQLQQPGQIPGQAPPAGQPQPNQLQPGQQPNQFKQPNGTGRDGRGGRGYDDRGNDYDRRDGRNTYDRRDGYDGRDPGRRDQFNQPGRPGYIPGGFRDSREDDDIRDYDRIRRDRREYEVDGRAYYREPGRIIVRDRDNYYIRHDENERFRDLDRRAYRSERRGAETYSYIDRPGGEQIVTVVDDDGRLVRRYRRFRDGREVVIINNSYGPGGPRPIYDDVVDLPPPDIRIPRDRYIVDYERADPRAVYGALTAPPVVAIDRRYTLDQVRYSPQLRARMPSVDINTITFDTGSFTVTPEQGRQLKNIADAINQAVQANPQEVFLIEGYTDAVGADIDNLSLSDRRAQSVATILTQTFQVPPENLTTQGYGEQYLKVNTQGPNRENRRVTVRRITPLLQQQADQQGAPPPAPPR